MKATMIIMLAVLAVATSTQVSEESSVGSSLTFDAADAKKRPVAKVVNLLKDMMAQMKKEAEEDEDVFDKFACWSETNMKEKSKAIADHNSKISDLTSSIDERTARAARLNTEIADLTKEAAADTKALEEATALRAKELAEFNAEEKSVIMTIMALKNALVSLSKHQSFLQSASQMQGVAVTVQEALNSHASLLAGALTPNQRRVVSAFVQSPTVTQTGGYDSQSGEIVGILKQMQETFETNLASTQKQEKDSVAAFTDLKAAKESEIKAGNDQIDTKSDQLAENNQKMAEEKEDRKDTEKSLAADEKFYDEVKTHYATEKGEYESRVKVRTEEMEAVSKAEEILNNDDAHELLGKSLGFLQTDMQADRRSRAEVAKLLTAVSQKVQNPRLAAMAVAVRIDAFGKVKKAIDGMTVQLHKQKADERKQKDFCTEELNENAMNVHRATVEKDDLQILIDKLTEANRVLAEAVKALEVDIARLRKNLKIADDAREKQRKEFVQTIMDQKASQKVLKSALTVLKAFYAAKAEHAPDSLLQTKQPLMAGGDDYKTNGASGKVMGMIQKIIDEAKAMEAEAERDEAAAKKDHAAFTKQTMDTINGVDYSGIDHKRATIADNKAALVEAGKDKETNAILREQLDLAKTTLHQDCDFGLKNFNVRQSAIDEEVDALKQAKAILSGSKFEAFLQNA